MIGENNTRGNQIISLLLKYLENRISAKSLVWLKQKTVEINNGAASRIFFISYSAVPRYLGKEKLNLSSEELQLAIELVPGWNPANWTVDQVGRTLLLLSFPSADAVMYAGTLEKIIRSADVSEAIAFYQSLALLPHPEKFQLRAAEGIRTNMTSVFNAVAHHNPYPAEYLDDLAWNQMVLKALFVGSSLKPIYGLERRNNLELSQMLIDYARERLAANRAVSNELWELVIPFQPAVVAKLQQESNKVRH
ncbi:MAG: EboA family metabolite traffic protein [Cyanobacteria bacterium P01_G01_bin.39]